ncbi:MULTISPECIES: KGK domain-containing protein [unclassified Microcoleus]|uniref:KGK domain-containing protein n=1 Tax=unclassified Microcoleus TaxID=2642155 RepID=UPI002FD234C5
MSNNDDEEKFIKLDYQEVLWLVNDWKSLNKDLGVNSYFAHPIISIGQFQTYLKNQTSIQEEIKSVLFGEGIEGEVLRFGSQGWKKGKIRVQIVVEFCPDEPEVEETPENNESQTSQPESPLDDLRRKLLNQENSAS